jgi:integrase
MKKYTEASIKSLKWEKDKRISLGDSLYLNLRRSSKTFLIRKQGQDKQVITLGKFPTLSLKQARLKAMQMKLSGGVSNMTMSELIDKYRTDIVEPESRVPKQVEGYLRNIDDEFGNRKLMDVNRAMLVNYIQRYSERGARTADRMRSYLKQILGYGVELGWLETNPMIEVSRRVSGYRPVPRTRTLNQDEIKTLFTWQHKNANVLRFLLLTGLRITESRLGYREKDKWIVPKEISKNGIAHWVHLSPLALAQLPLPTCTATNIQSWLKWSQGNNDNRYTPHDLRRTFATLGNEHGIAPHIIEKCLNHRLEGMMAVYNHAVYEDERIAATLKIEELVNEIID